MLPDHDFYDLLNGDPAYLGFVKKYYNITLKHFDRLEPYPFIEIDDPLYEYYNILLSLYTRLRLNKIFIKKNKINTGLLEYKPVIGWCEKFDTLEEIINRKTKIILYNSINFLPVVEEKSLDKKGLYLILHQEIGNITSKSRHSNFTRYKDYNKNKPSKFSFNHVGLLFFHDALQEWHVLEYLIVPTISTLSVYMGNNSSGTIYLCKLEKIILSSKDKDLLYKKMHAYGQLDNVSILDKKNIKDNIFKFGFTKAFASCVYHYSDAKDYKSVVNRNWENFLNKKRRVIAYIWYRLGFESEKRNICSKYAIEVINEINPHYWIETNKLGQKITSKNYMPRDVLNLILYKDNKTVEDSVLVLK